MDNEEKLEQEIYLKMGRLCSRSEQCTPDIRKKIKELGGTSILAVTIIDRLEKEMYLNDERYARSFVRDKFRLNHWGKIKIQYYLKMKGLSDRVIETGLAEIEEEEYIKTLLKTMKEKAKTVKVTNKFEKMGQIIRFTQSRGFEPELIHRHLNEVIS